MIEAAHYQWYDLLQCQFLEMVLHKSEKGAFSTLWLKQPPLEHFVIAVAMLTSSQVQDAL